MPTHLRAAEPLRGALDRLAGRSTDERTWRKGALGERFNGWLLERLPQGWHAFHDIPVGTSGVNIDHLVVGPAGVFTVNTKNLSGKIWLATRTLRVNGRMTDLLPKATSEARRAARLLEKRLGRPITVTPILSIIADEWTVMDNPMDVFVATPRGVKKWLLGRPASLDPGDVTQIARAAAEPETWR
jgi:Nuclease-related domain